MDIRPSVRKAPDAEAVTDAHGADVTASVRESRASAASASETTTAPVGSVDTTIRDRYLASVLSKIESHKFYPSPAQRRGLQGRVDVRFTLDAHGGISELDVTGGNSMFVVAARDAINNALPLPAAPSADGFPLAVHYQMIFRLQ
jgi:protein TonB